MQTRKGRDRAQRIEGRVVRLVDVLDRDVPANRPVPGVMTRGAIPGIAMPGAVARARWRLNRRRRTAELAQIVAHLTALVALGLPLRHALARTAQDGRGAVVDDLAVVDGWICDGLPTPDALRRWAATTAWEDLGHVVAATVGPPCDLVARLDAAGQALAQRVHDDRIGVATLAAHAVWALVVTALVLALVA